MKALVLACALLLPGLAAAQPLLVPGADVDATYRVSGAAAERIPGGAADGVRLQWDAAGQRLRAEPLGGPLYAIVDLGRHVAEVVFAAQKAVLEARLRAGDPQTLLAGADVQFTRRGNETVVGLPCTDWTVHARKLDGTACITADGIVLRADGSYDGQPGSMQAVSVSRGRIPARQFTVPDGFFRMPFGSR